ncbi:MAG: indole-3-glycerol phosphate synthase TrpC [Verrucomicrobia bacterium]|nr:indole-3-glycerol phosphate synthase TrpC [Verrucomicrobiota bacterium]
MASNRLQQILDVKCKEVARILPKAPLLRAAALERNDFRPFVLALDQGPNALGLIAEVKKASPSVGIIAQDFDPLAIARSYEDGGAHALSILTDKEFFQGDISYLSQIRKAVDLPLLRKDFIIHEVQIAEAAVAGADAILLIVAALQQDRLEALYAEAQALQLDVLVEVHNMEELERALELGANCIGINNRNLTNFEVDLATTENLSEEVPESVILVCESGLKTRADTQRALDAGCNAILVGETLMRASDVPAQIHSLLDVR